MLVNPGMAAKRITAQSSGTATADKACTCSAPSLEPARRLGELTCGYCWS